MCIYMYEYMYTYICMCIHTAYMDIYVCMYKYLYLSIDEYVYIYSGGLHRKFKSFLGQHWSSFFHSKVRNLAEVCAQQVR